MIERFSKKKIVFASHLNDVDDLKTYGRNTPIENSIENDNYIENISNFIIKKIKLNNKKGVLFVSSNKDRTIQTAHLLGEAVKNKSDNTFKIRYSVEDRLRGNDQGEIILPESYKPKDVFEGFVLGNKVYRNETFDKGNIDYRFGDPVKISDSEYKYPELIKHFKSFGESYREVLIRILSTLLELSEKSHKLDSSMEIVIVAHGLPYQIFRGLSIISEDIKKQKYKNIKEVEDNLISCIWNIYKNNPGDIKVEGYDIFDLSLLEDKTLIDLIRRKIDDFKKYER